jgi:hypothetical protein
MSEFSTRFFADDVAVRRVGEGLLARTLPRAEWTHEAHLAACLWLHTERPEIDAPRDLPAIIRAYNESVGGVNDDTQGYHETLTQFYILSIRAFLCDCGESGLAARVNALLASERGMRDWPLRFYSREVLFSVTARRGWVEPDLNGPFPIAPERA